jgi:hypothetical protein
MVKIFKHQDQPSWFLADETGVILIDGCADLEMAIRARQRLLTGLHAAMIKAKPIEADSIIPSWKRALRSLAG